MCNFLLIFAERFNIVLVTREDFEKIRKLRHIRSLHDGSQTLAYLCKSDILIYAGERGVGKSSMLLTKFLPKIDIRNYNSLILRREYGDSEGTGGIVDASDKYFSQFGNYFSSMRNWKFNSGAKIGFGNYSDPIEQFRENVQGKENVDVGVDEITQMPEEYFNEVLSNLRNTIGESTQIIGTCNPDGNSWIKRLIARFLETDTGYHLDALNGRELYFFQYGNKIDESIWGLTKEEVYENAKQFIDPYWDKSMEKYGSVLDLILSISVFDAKTRENKSLMENGGIKYKAKLLKGTIEMKQRYAINCWNTSSNLNSLITDEDLSNFFYNSKQTTGERFASMDIGGEGSDKSTMWIWDGFHITNVYMIKSKKATELLNWAKTILTRERIDFRNFVYDAIGVGFAFSGSFDGAFQFISNAKQTELRDYDNKLKKIYANFKSQTIGIFLKYLKLADVNGGCGISIEDSLLGREFFGKTVRQHLSNESRAICWDDSRDGVLKSIGKSDVKKILGHSADVMLGLIYRFAFQADEINEFTFFEEHDFERVFTFINS